MFCKHKTEKKENEKKIQKLWRQKERFFGKKKFIAEKRKSFFFCCYSREILLFFSVFEAIEL